MNASTSLSVGDLFLADPKQISKEQIKGKTSRWAEVDSISVTHNENGALTHSFIAEVTHVSNGSVQADKVTPEGDRLVLPGDELAITLDTIDSEERVVADVSAASNIDQVFPSGHRKPGTTLQVRIIQTSGATAYADVLSVQESGVTVGDSVDVHLKRGSPTAEFEAANLASFDCRLNQKPTAGGPAVAYITGCSTEGIECKLVEVTNQLEIGDRYEMTVKHGEAQAKPQWNDSIGVTHVALDEPAAASTTAVVKLTEVEGAVTGRIVEYQNLPGIGSTHHVSLDRGQDRLVLDAVPVHLDGESEVSGEVTIEVTSGEVPLNGRITEYHDLPEAGMTVTVPLDRGQDFVLLDGVPVEFEEASRISGDVSLEIVGEGPPFEGKIAEYHGLPESGEVIDCRVSRGASEVVRQGIPVQFSPASRVGGLDSRLKVLDPQPPVDARLIDYPSLEEGSMVRAEVDSDDLSIAYADEGDYRIDLVEQAEKAASIRVRLVTVSLEKIIGEIEGYLSIGSIGQKFNRDPGNSPFRSGTSKNDEITGKKL